MFELEDGISLAVTHITTIDAVSLFKALEVRFDNEIEDLPGKLCSYLKICAEFLKTRLIIIVGMHESMTSEEIALVHRTAVYEKVSLLDIERHVPMDVQDFEKLYIIDNDLCEIYND